jgi:DNA-binding transcriptional ArsR family regulator
VLERELPVGELAEHVGLSQPAASQHLKVLRDAGLVRGRVDGRRRLYQVDAEGLERLRRELDAYWGPALAALKDAAEAP